VSSRTSPQLELDLEPPTGHGGRREGAGRKKGRHPRVWHRARPAHQARHPVHVTLRAKSGLPSFVQQRVRGLMKKLLHDQRKSPRRYREAFHVAHFSIQTNHVHLIVEAVRAAEPGYDASRTLCGGISGFAIAFARRLNKMLSRAGKVWDDRYHRHDLKTPTETKNALRYVFQNAKKHGHLFFGDGCVDLYSSAPSFDGWSDPHATIIETEPWPEVIPKTWLLARGWRKAGELFTHNRPS
jgi:hypothetical protein